jgi:hypothetical protein
MIKYFIRFIVLKIISPIKWPAIRYMLKGRPYNLRPVDRELAREMMKGRLYLWVSRRDTHLSTYIISFTDWLLDLVYWAKGFFKGPRPRFGYWAHAFFNISHNVIVESVSSGVVKSYFDDVFDCDAAAALVPKYMTAHDWDALRTDIEHEIESHIGKPYDVFFNLKDGGAVSCIELVRLVLKNKVPDYDLKFKRFEAIIESKRNVTPQMLYDSGDFVVEWQVGKK